MLLSKSCEYGIRASLFLAMQPESVNVPIREISDKLNISFHFLTKILQTLTHEGFVSSFKGPKGGVCLGKSSDKISIRDLIVAIDTDKVFTQCVLGLPGCGEKKPCPLHDKWANTRTALNGMLQKTTLQELALKVKQDKLRLTDSSSLDDILYR